VSQVFGSETLASDDQNDDSALSWAAKMRKQKAASGTKKKKSTKTRKEPEKESAYDEKDLEGMQVKNSMADIEAGSTAVLTLADASILETKTSSRKVVGINEEEDALEDIALTEREKQQDGLRKKRMLEMGMGRAGGYAGFDDEEFEELGGIGPSHRATSAALLDDEEDEESGAKKKQNRGFRIGSERDALADAAMTDFDKVQQGKTVSLVGKSDVAASDYMTIEEEEEEKEKRKKKKKETQFKKKKKKKDKDKKRRRKTEVEEDNEEEAPISNAGPVAGAGNLLLQLEETAEDENTSSLRKRRRTDDGEDDGTAPVASTRGPQLKRAKYDEIMEKGNQRTRMAFSDNNAAVKKEVPAVAIDEEPDDSFLNAALAKARRLNRLRAMNKAPAATGADAVVEAMKSTSVDNATMKGASGKLSFSIDETREFSRAIRARTQQKERTVATKKEGPVEEEPVKKDQDAVKVEDVEDGGEEVDMEELAKEVSTDDTEQPGFDGSTAASVGVGRGLSSFVSMLKTTGEITGKHGGKEELRGRAKDERNYENYEPMDLSKVVAIGQNATDKDKELASREIKLEYRDKHGRLLTQKEAFRDLCYQFHGHGASKKKEEKRLKQIAREQAEARMASRQISAARDGTAAGTLGALKATQKATGKAFIVHKT